MKLICTTIAFIATILLYGAIKPSFSANLANCQFTYSDPLNGTYTGTVSGGTGEMASLTSANGSFQTIINPDGTCYVLTVSTSISSTAGNKSTFTIQSNHLVNLTAGTLSGTAPTTYTKVTLVIDKGVNKGTYSATSVTSGGTTNAADFTQTNMNINGSF